MNDPADTSTPPIVAKPIVKMEDYVRQYPGGALLVAVGLGLAAVLITRAFNPPPPRNRAVQLLEDIQERLAKLAHVGFDRVSSLAEDGAHAVSNGVDSLGSLHLDRRLDKISSKLKSLFH